jgi:UDP-glucose 4-epimerase
MQTILVTGGAGYIGSKVSYDLIDKGYKVIAIDDLSTGYRKLVPKKCIFIKVDISKLANLEKVFKKYKFNTVFHFAAKKKVDESQKYPLKYFNTNVVGTKNLLDLIVKYKVKNLIFSSTCAVYGNASNTRVSEKDLLIPESYYGYTKLISENTIIEYQKKNKFNYAILRYFNVVGADNKLRTGEINNGSLFKNLCESLKKNKIFQIYGNDYNTKDGTCIRDYIDINDLSNIHLLSYKFIQRKKSIIFNCGYSKPISVMEVFTQFRKIYQKKIKFKFRGKRLGDIKEIYSNNRLQKKIFPNWKRKFDLKHSILSTLKWEKLFK